MPLFIPHRIFDRILRIRPYILHSVLLIKILKKTDNKNTFSPANNRYLPEETLLIQTAADENFSVPFLLSVHYTLFLLPDFSESSIGKRTGRIISEISCRFNHQIPENLMISLLHPYSSLISIQCPSGSTMYICWMPSALFCLKTNRGNSFFGGVCWKGALMHCEKGEW